MLKDVINTIEYFAPNLAMASNVMVFLGGGYVALHSRVMPKWAVTCLWYLGLASLLNFITYIVEFTVDQYHPLSHFQVGSVTETMVHMVLACTVGFLFFHTVWKDYLGARARRRAIEEAPVRSRTVLKRATSNLNNKGPSTKKAPLKRPQVKKSVTEDLLREERINF